MWNVPSATIRAATAKRRKPFRRFSDHELRKEATDLQKRLASFRESGHEETKSQVQARLNAIHIELFERNAESFSSKDGDAGRTTKLAMNPQKKFVGASARKLRQDFVKPFLEKKGLSIHDWAKQSRVDFHTANGYLRGKTNPYPSTRKKLADALGVKADDLPA